MNARLIRMSCWSIAAVALVMGALAWAWPVRTVVPAVAPSTGATLARMAVAHNTSVAEEIVLANAFATSRTPPGTRYAPVETVTDTAAGFAVEPSRLPGMPMMPGPDSLTLAGDVPRLYGTVVSPRGTSALLHLTDAGPRLYIAGDRDGVYRVISIAPGEVVLRGPTGRVTLRLEPEEGRR